MDGEFEEIKWNLIQDQIKVYDEEGIESKYFYKAIKVVENEHELIEVLTSFGFSLNNAKLYLDRFR